VKDAVRRCAEFFAKTGVQVEERTPPGMEQAYELELALLGADGAEGIDEYLRDAGSIKVHVLHRAFVDHMRPYRTSAYVFAQRWAQWDEYRANLARFFAEYDAVLCPVYTQPALPHRGSLDEQNFQGFSYTMAWNLAGAPAGTVRCTECEGLPINVQIVAKPWRDLLALEICRCLEAEFGGWKPARALEAAAL
jgi:amidase